MSTASTTRTAHYVLSTHWDREWYEPFQLYRYRLVQLMDRILEGMEDGRLKGPFQTDGQSIILQDYLEIRPERREQVERYVREGRMVVGPWYVLPDEFLVSGESHIRNIRIGREIVRRIGAEPSQAGFICDLFGHISQMPQIFAGFGIKAGYLWRGIATGNARQVVWAGADGTELVCHKFVHHGYGEFARVVREGDQFDKSFDRQRMTETLDNYIKLLASESEIDSILLFDGCDHQEWDEDVYTILADRLGKEVDGVRIVHTSLDEYSRELLAQKDRISNHLSGELRAPAKDLATDGHQISGVLSSRAWIKQDNAACENLLVNWAEPFNAYSSIVLGTEYPHGFLETAWRWLIENHPHDSICGCSVDLVHEDMKYRFSQCGQIGERITLQALRWLAASIEGDVEEEQVRVVVFNPLSHPIDEVVDLVLEVPPSFPRFNEFFGFEEKPSFFVTGPDGKEIPYQRNGQQMNRNRLRLRDTKFPEGYKVDEVRVSLPLSIPACGYTTLTLTHDVEKRRHTRYPQDRGLASSERSMENENIAVRVEANGTLTLTDKRTGEVYTDLLTFEDRADIGDGWFHGVAINDRIYVSSAAQADVALIENGPYSAAFRIRTIMHVPEEFDFAKMQRVERRVEMIVDSIVRLRKGADRLEIGTTIDNTANDHRVRVLFPSGAETDTYHTDTPFDVIKRPIALRDDNHLHAELDVETRPMQQFCAVADRSRGLAVVSTGQYEVCVRDLDNKPIALTLFRGTRRTVGTDGEPEGQLRQRMTFRYFVKPIRGSIDHADLFSLGRRVASGFRTIHLRPQDQTMYRLDKSLPVTGGLFTIDGEGVLSSARMADGSLEVRLFNPSGDETEATVSLGKGTSFKSFQPVNFESRPAGESSPVKAGKATVTLRPRQILTLQFK